MPLSPYCNHRCKTKDIHTAPRGKMKWMNNCPHFCITLCMVAAGPVSAPILPTLLVALRTAETQCRQRKCNHGRVASATRRSAYFRSNLAPGLKSHNYNQLDGRLRFLQTGPVFPEATECGLTAPNPLSDGQGCCTMSTVKDNYFSNLCGGLDR